MSGSNRIASLPLDALSGGSATGYNGNFHLRLPVGTSYRFILLNLINLTIAQIARVSMTLNGDEIMRVSGSDLDKLRKSVGLYTDDSTLVIPFVDMSQKLIKDQNASELVVGAGENLVLKIETGAAIVPDNDGQTASIEGRMEVSTMARPLGRQVLPRLFSDTLNGNRTGDNRYKGLLTQNKSGNDSKLVRLFLKSANVASLRMYKNKIEVFNKTRADNDFDLRAVGSIQQVAEYMYNAVGNGFATIDALDVPNDFEMVAELSGTGDFDVLYQTIEKVA